MYKNNKDGAKTLKLAEYKKMMAKKTKKPSKYRNKITTLKVNWRGRKQEIKFHSIFESDNFLLLLDIENRGKIKNLSIQEKFVLLSNETDTIKFIIDFYYYDCVDNVWVAEEIGRAHV